MESLRGYRRDWLAPDLVAGLTLVAIAVPEQLATARLAGLPPITGLYAFLAGSLVFAVVGRSPLVSVGADSTIAPIFAAGVAGIAAVGSPRYGNLVLVLALMVGALVMAAGALRIGAVADFLSTPVITGVLGGIAVEIVVRQLPVVLGVAGGGTSTVTRLHKVAGQLGHINGWSVAIAAAVLVIIVGGERISRRVPGALIGLVASIVFVGGLHLKAHGVAVVGVIHGGLPTLGFPTTSLANVRRMLPVAFIVAFVVIAQTAATVRAATKTPETGEFNRDLIGVGAGSVVAGLAGAFPVNASPPRTEVVVESGGQSQVSGLVAVGVVLVLVLAATGLLRDLPQATLGAILLFVASRLFRVDRLRAVWGYDRIEFGVAVVTLLAVALVGIEAGVVVAMVLALADRTRRSARPRDAVLGRLPGTDHWISPDVGEPTEQVPGVLVYLLYAPLWYGNADHVRQRVRHLIETATVPVRAFIIDADAMSDIDFTGSEAMGTIAAELERRHIELGIARSSHLVHRALKHSGLLESIGPERLFTSVGEAVTALAPHDREQGRDQHDE